MTTNCSSTGSGIATENRNSATSCCNNTILLASRPSNSGSINYNRPQLLIFLFFPTRQSASLGKG